MFVGNLGAPWSSGAWGPGPNGPVVNPPLMVPMQLIDVPFAATMVSSGGADMLPTSSFICLRKSSPATVASAPVSGVAWALVMKLWSALW